LTAARRLPIALLFGGFLAPFWTLIGLGEPVTAAAMPQAVAPPAAAIWVGHAAQMEAHLKNAAIVSMEDIGTGVTKPQRAHLTPAEPFENLVWKPLPPGRRGPYMKYLLRSRPAVICGSPPAYSRRIWTYRW